MNENPPTPPQQPIQPEPTPQPAPQSPIPIAPPPPDQQQPIATPPPPPQPTVTPAPQMGGTPPAPGQVQVGMSANQMGISAIGEKKFNFKKIAIILSAGLAALVVVIAVLTLTGIIPLLPFRSISYTNSEGQKYKLDFYAKHTTRNSSGGNTELVSKVSKDGKLPIVLLINSTDSDAGFDKVEDCSGYTKVTEVHNHSLDKKIAVCDILGGKAGGVAIYVAGFKVNNKVHVITIGQDYAGADVSNPTAAKESLDKLGLDPYKADIERIVSSVKVE